MIRDTQLRFDHYLEPISLSLFVRWMKTFSLFLHIRYGMSFEDELIMNQYLHSIEVMSFILSIFLLKKYSESVSMAGKATFVQELVALLETVLICFSDKLLNHSIF
jgi:hypothetical protein